MKQEVWYCFLVTLAVMLQNTMNPDIEAFNAGLATVEERQICETLATRHGEIQRRFGDLHGARPDQNHGPETLDNEIESDSMGLQKYR